MEEGYHTHLNKDSIYLSSFAAQKKTSQEVFLARFLVEAQVTNFPWLQAHQTECVCEFPL